MKFLKIIFCLFLLLVCVFSSCSDIDNITENGQKYLNIEVEDENEKCMTRVNYDGFPVTHFETDDKIGVIVSSSSGVTENVCFTKQADGTWRTETPILYDANAKYYAYYPYDEKAPSVNIGGETVDDVFASFDNQFWFADQSQKEYFDKSNLMTSEGVASGSTVKFTMKHKRALAVFYVDGVYDFGNYVPYTMENKKYFLMKPYENYIMGDFLMAAGEGQYVTKIIEKDYMKFVALEDATFTFNKSSSANITYLAYSIDNGKTWVKETGSFTTPVVKKNTAILWKGKAQKFYSSTFSATGKFSAKGNIMSLLYGEEDFRYKKSFSATDALRYLFYNNNKLVDAGELQLSATTLANSCYSYMFSGCTALTKAPELPATTLANSCYSYMFKGCTALTKAPELPAETLANNCYYFMFYGCTALTKAPELPATTLTDWCYNKMFCGCTALTKAPELPATTFLKYNCYYEMFEGCKNLMSVTMLAPSDEITNTASNGHFLYWLDDAGTKATSRTLKVKDKAAYDALVSNGVLPANYWQTGKCTILDAAGNAIVE